GEADRRGRIVLHDAGRGRLLAGRAFSEQDQCWERLIGLRAATERGLEYIFESARSDLIGIGLRQNRELGALGHFGDAEREARQPRAGGTDEVGFLRDHALGGILRFLYAVAGVEYQKLHLGAAERFDAALLVDVVDRKVGALEHQVALAGPRTRHRRDQSDLHFLGLRRRRSGNAEARAKADAEQHRQHGQRSLGRHGFLLQFVFVIARKIYGKLLRLPVAAPLARRFTAAIDVARSAKAPIVEHLPNGPSTRVATKRLNNLSRPIASSSSR